MDQTTTCTNIPTTEDLLKAPDSPLVVDNKCCCRLVPIKMSSYIISTIFAFFIISNFLVKIAGYSDLEWNWELLFLCSDSVAVACLFYGTYVESAAYFQPFVVLSIITVSFLILLLAYTGAAVYDSQSYPGEYLELLLHEHLSVAAQRFNMELKDMVSLFASIASVVLIISVVCHIWFVIIAIKCARYFRMRRNNRDPSAVKSTATSRSGPSTVVIDSKAKRPVKLVAEPLYDSIHDAYTESPLNSTFARV